jgi:hypothetical protein
MSTTYTMGTHYTGAWLGYALAAFAIGWRDAQKIRAVSVACVALCIVELAVANPTHPGLNLRRYEERDRMVDIMANTYGPHENVATQEEIFTHLALTHPNVTLLPEDPNQPLDACFAMVDRSFPESVRLIEYGATLERLRKEGAYYGYSFNGPRTFYIRQPHCR